ncbi:hypothetical protein DYB36_012089 [Aphanomyces astaci]|uniref:MARVEL domain-containing protein n=1 Tax=Aphanomyces astaci TaxID=112090 RepID=A0A397BW12_APHAT|nr:hypothetical protein DYB36_012089 [Aphanomyces astaci]
MPSFPTIRGGGMKKVAWNSMIVTGLRSTQVLMTGMTTVFMLISYRDVSIKEDGGDWRFAQLPHFFAVMVSAVGFVYSLLYCILVLAMDYWSHDVLLERIADAVLAVCLAICGVTVGSNGGCKLPSTLQNCTNLRGTIGCLYVSAVVYLVSFVHSMLTQEVFNPDAHENLVPRGNYGPSIILSPEPTAAAPNYDNTIELKPRGNFGAYSSPRSLPYNDNTLDLKPRGNFGSVQTDMHPKIARDDSGGLI